MATRRGHVRIGTSGYQYDHWKGRFYPEGLPKKQWFSHFAAHFDTVEINNTFYNLPDASTFEDWARQAPGGFCFALKFSRFGTHMKKLRDPENSVSNFVSRAKLLGGHLGPILVQLPPHWRANPERLDAFLRVAPDAYRWAVEMRDASWLCDAVYDVLRGHGAALCLHDLIANHPRVVTAGWVYERYHGDHYGGAYSHQALTAIAERYAEYRDEGLDVYAYFNNDEDAHAVTNARDLKRYLEKR